MKMSEVEFQDNLEIINANLIAGNMDEFPTLKEYVERYNKMEGQIATQLADVDRVLDELKQFSEILEKLKKEGFNHENSDDMKRLSNFGIELALDKAMIERLKSAHQTHTELIKTYGGK